MEPTVIRLGSAPVRWQLAGETDTHHFDRFEGDFDLKEQVAKQVRWCHPCVACSVRTVGR